MNPMMNESPRPVDDREIRAAEREHDRVKDYELKIMDAATRDATEAMKVALAINGGTAVAVLTFSGAINYRGGIALGDLKLLLTSLGLFGIGVACASVTAALAYFANSLYSASHGAKELIWTHPYVRANENLLRIGGGHVERTGPLS
jgi:hypothetical protein